MIPTPKARVFSKTTSVMTAYEAGKGRSLNIQEICAYAARVSNPGNQMNNETSGRLLNYCMRNAHWSVFEMADVTLEITTTRDIARQMLRHNSFRFQEFSQRYADPTGHGLSTGEARLQDKRNRQNSISEGIDPELVRQWEAKQQQLNHETLLAYKWAVDNGIALECARKILPEGNTSSTLFMKGSVRSWIHFLDVRFAPYVQYKPVDSVYNTLGDEIEAYEQVIIENGTQKEHKDVAKACLEALVDEELPFLKNRYAK